MDYMKENLGSDYDYDLKEVLKQVQETPISNNVLFDYFKSLDSNRFTKTGDGAVSVTLDKEDVEKIIENASKTLPDTLSKSEFKTEKERKAYVEELNTTFDQFEEALDEFEIVSIPLRFEPKNRSLEADISLKDGSEELSLTYVTEYDMKNQTVATPDKKKVVNIEEFLTTIVTEYAHVQY
jgi:hypothetical protein